MKIICYKVFVVLFVLFFGKYGSGGIGGGIVKIWICLQKYVMYGILYIMCVVLKI